MPRHEMGPEMGGEYDWYEKDIPNQGKPFEENGKMVYWNMANAGDSVEQVMSSDKDEDGSGRKPLEAKEVTNENGEKAVIVKWQEK